MYSKHTSRFPHLYGYTQATDQDENDSDVADLYQAAAKDGAKRLVVFGGLHGYDPSGEPTGQTNAEKSVCSFSMDDRMAKGVGKGVNFIYENVAKLTTNGSDVSEDNQKKLIQKIRSYLESDSYYVLVSWCYSRNWLVANGL